MSEEHTNETGSLIPFHQHNNLDLLQLFTNTNDVLKYNDIEIGLSVNNTYIDNAINNIWDDIDNDSNYNWLRSDTGGVTS